MPFIGADPVVRTKTVVMKFWPSATSVVRNKYRNVGKPTGQTAMATIVCASAVMIRAAAPRNGDSTGPIGSFNGLPEFLLLCFIQSASDLPCEDNT
jgi:hypothetical protein